LVIDPVAAIRDFAEHATGGDSRQLATANELRSMEEWGKVEDYRKVILEVIKARLDLPWPYSYKALDILAVMPVTSLMGFTEQLKKLSALPTSVLGAAEVKKAAAPLLGKAKAEKAKVDEADAKAKQEAVLQVIPSRLLSTWNID